MSLARTLARSLRPRNGCAAGAEMLRTTPRTVLSRRAMSTSSGQAGTAAIGPERHSSAMLVAMLAGGATLGVALLSSDTLQLEGPTRKSFAERLGEKAQKKIESGKEKVKEAMGMQEDGEEEEEGEQAGKQQSEGQAESRQDAAEKGRANEKRAGTDQASSLDLDDLSEEASQQSAFDPETNTINWDCPCLGGMAHGPCGEQFKDAFSCFVFSESDPKGVDCIEKFQAMQDCFRKYPEHYKEELEDDEEFERAEAAQEHGSPSDLQVTATTDANASDKGSKATEEDDDEGVREWRAAMEKEKGGK